MEPNETADLAFVADNPSDGMLHWKDKGVRNHFAVHDGPYLSRYATVEAVERVGRETFSMASAYDENSIRFLLLGGTLSACAIDSTDSTTP